MDRQSPGSNDKAQITLARMGIVLPWWGVAKGAPASQDQAPAGAPIARTARLLSESLSEQLSPAASPAAPVHESAAPAVAETPAPAPVSTVAPFTVMFWFCEAGWLVASTATGQHAQALPAHTCFAKDLVQAITGKPVQWAGQEAMSWPPAGNMHSSMEEARDVVEGCLKRWCGKYPVSDVILLGNDLAQWLDIDVAGKPLGIQYLESIGQRCLALPAWPGQHTADSKRQLWRLMAALQAQS